MINVNNPKLVRRNYKDVLVGLFHEVLLTGKLLKVLSVCTQLVQPIAIVVNTLKVVLPLSLHLSVSARLGDYINPATGIEQ